LDDSTAKALIQSILANARAQNVLKSCERLEEFDNFVLNFGQATLSSLFSAAEHGRLALFMRVNSNGKHYFRQIRPALIPNMANPDVVDRTKVFLNYEMQLAELSNLPAEIPILISIIEAQNLLAGERHAADFDVAVGDPICLVLGHVIAL